MEGLQTQTSNDVRSPQQELPKTTVGKVSPRQLRELGIRLQKADQLDKAIGIYKAYLYACPHDAAIWSNLGAALRKQRRFDLAISCYHRGLEASPEDLALRSNLANALKNLHRLDESIKLHQQVIAEKPDDTQALMNYACALRNAGRFEEALQQLDRAQGLEPDNAGVEWERAQNLLYLGRYEQAWPAYEARWRTGELPVREFPCPQWQGEKLENQTILVHAEQGYGDTILAARFIPLLKEQGATVILQCKPELHRLFAGLGADQLISPSATPPTTDYHCPIMSLMGPLNIRTHNIPPPAKLNVPQEARAKFTRLHESESDALKVGIVWSGSVTFANNANRSINVEQLIPLSHIPRVRLYSFQKGPRARELYDSGADCIIRDLDKQLDDFADTAAALECMDLIVMTDSSVAHLAASMGKPVINLIEKVPYWLYRGEEETSPWYPSMILVRQQEPGQWDRVIERAVKLVRGKTGSPRSIVDS